MQIRYVQNSKDKNFVQRTLCLVLLGGTILGSSFPSLAATESSGTAAQTVGTEALLSAPIKPIANAVAATSVPMVAGAAEMEFLREENAKLTRALADQRQNFENAQAANSGAALNELWQKLDAANVENDRLKRMVQEAQATNKSAPAPQPDATAKLSALSANLQKANQTLAALQSENAALKATAAAKAETDAKFTALQAENKNLKTALVSKSSSDATLASVSAEAKKTAQSLSAIQAENATLKNQIALYQSKEKATGQDSSATQAQIKLVSDKLSAVQLENQTLKNQIETLKASANAKPQQVAVPTVDPKLQQQIAALQTENASLRTQIQKQAAIKTPVPAPVTACEDTSKLRTDLLDTRVQKDTLVAERNALQAQLEKLQQDINTVQLKQSGGNWDLEQATRRYQESQREIQRLGALLQTQQTKCTSEKKEIEGMLFDPAITDKAQIAMVDSLKAELAEKDNRIKELELGAMAKGQSLTPIVSPKEGSPEWIALQDENAFLKQQISEAKASMARRDIAKSSLQAASAQSLEMATMRGQLEQSNKRLSELQQKLTSPNAGVVSVPPVAPPVPLGASKSVMPPSAPQPVAVPSKPPSDLEFASIGDFMTMLKSAGVSLRGGLQQIKGGDPETYRAYSWKTSSLIGSVEMRYAPTADAFGNSVEQYLNRAKSRCAGEFAAIPSETRAANIGMSKAYEIACVGDDASSSASVLFTYGDNIAMTIAHEGRAEAMEMAMDVRDKIAEKIR